MSDPGDRTAPPFATTVVLLLAFGKILIHLWDHPAYGYFRDELYYLACADHLAWGYVDHPPLSIAVLALTRAIAGDSMFAIRLPAVLSGSLMVVATAWLARELGGGRFAQVLAAVTFFFMPVALGMSTFYSMNALDLVFWVGAVAIVVRAINRNDPRLWLAFGLVAGLGMLNKISVGFLVFGLVVGLALTQHRRYLLSAWFWLGAAVAIVVFAPHIWWQIANGFPTLEFMHNARTIKMQPMSLGQYLGAQVLYTSPAAVPVWIGGLIFLLFAAAARPYRFLGIAYLAILFLLIAQQGKAYYLAPAYSMLFAAGGVAWERLSTRRRMGWLRPLLLLLVFVLGLGALPLAVPLLPPDDVVRYAAAIGVEAPKEERQQRASLSQHFADRFGWENLAATVARVYASLPPEEHADAVVVAGNYGEAGAIDFFGRRHQLPPALSIHNNYWLWGPGTARGEVAIVVGVRREDLARFCGEVAIADTVVSEYAMAYETDLPVYVCRHLKRPLRDLWPELKRFV